MSFPLSQSACSQQLRLKFFDCPRQDNLTPIDHQPLIIGDHLMRIVSFVDQATARSLQGNTSQVTMDFHPWDKSHTIAIVEHDQEHCLFQKPMDRGSLDNTLPLITYLDEVEGQPSGRSSWRTATMRGRLDAADGIGRAYSQTGYSSERGQMKGQPSGPSWRTASTWDEADAADGVSGAYSQAGYSSGYGQRTRQQPDSLRLASGNSSEGETPSWSRHQPESDELLTNFESGPRLGTQSENQKSTTSVWVSVAVVIGALFAVAMVARFGGGIGMSTSGANIFAGVTGGALGAYVFSALSNYCNRTQEPKYAYDQERREGEFLS